jgi:uncharacterized membrane protein YfcA
MTVLVFTFIMLAAAFLAGFTGALTGLGGGVVLVPLLTLVFKVDIHYAIGTSLVAVIATSSGAAAAYVKEGITNIRLGMFLEIATTLGALIGATIIVYMPTNIIAVIFGAVLIFSAIMTIVKKKDPLEKEAKSKLALLLKLNSNYPGKEGKTDYTVRHVPAGFLMMIGAGMLSALLGIGSGAFKVLAMDNVMRVPFKVSTTTSNFMIGVTAAASSVLYFHRGYIDPVLTFPVVIGVFAGAIAGARVLIGSGVRTLRIVFSVVITAVAIEMIYNGIKGSI